MFGMPIKNNIQQINSTCDDMIIVKGMNISPFVHDVPRCQLCYPPATRSGYLHDLQGDSYRSTTNLDTGRHKPDRNAGTNYGKLRNQY